MKGTRRHIALPITQIFYRIQEIIIIINNDCDLTVLMYISIMAFGQHTIRTSRSAMLRLRRKRLVEDLMDLEVRMTIRTRTLPTTPTASTKLKHEVCPMIILRMSDLRLSK